MTSQASAPPFILCIDLEPDERHPSSNHESLPGVEAAFSRMEVARASLSAATGHPVHFSWFLRIDSQIEELWGRREWLAARYEREIRARSADGDEIGLHVHFFRRDRGQWITDTSDDSFIEGELEAAFGRFRTAIQQGCRSFRFGDRWLSASALNIIESLGARYDLTGEPGISGAPFHPPDRYRGSFPDFRGLPLHPYHPAKDDFNRITEADRPLWMIPVSTGNLDRRWKALPQRWKRRGTKRGSLTVRPDPVRLDDDGLASVLVEWTARGTGRVDIRVGSPDGPLFCGGAASGSQRTGRWARDGLQLFLQNTSETKPDRVEATLATATVHGVSDDPALLATPGRRTERAALSLALPPADFSSVLGQALTASRPIVLATRSDAFVRPQLRGFVQENLESLIATAAANGFRFVTPAESIEKLT